MVAQNKKKNLGEIASVFFKLGCIAFGGPAAHIAMMDDEIVQKRKWLSREHYLDLIGATNLVPGPNSTEMTMHCGYERGGIAGLFIAGITFIVPAVVLTGILAYLYVAYGSLPNVKPFIVGIQPMVIAIIAGATYKLGKKAIKNTELSVLGALVVVGSFIPQLNEIILLLAAGLLGAMYFTYKAQSGTSAKTFILPLLMSTGKTIGAKLMTFSIFLKFLKIGAILYGSGYVLFAYLDVELVQTGYLSQAELMDAIAVGQFTPGPVLSTATFIGYQLGGFSGALAATLGIFLPSFLFVFLLNPLIPRMRKSKFLGYFLDAVNVASLGIMAAVLISLGESTIHDWRLMVIAGLGLFFTFGPFKLSALYLVLVGSVSGYLIYLV